MNQIDDLNHRSLQSLFPLLGVGKLNGLAIANKTSGKKKVV